MAVVALTVASPLVQAEPVGGPFTLTGPDGRAIADTDFRGQWMLIYFGYASCPDACPTDLQRMADVLDALGPLAGRVQPIFITLDPRRDRPESLTEHVRMFHPRLIGLGGSEAQIDEVARRYHVRFVRNAPDSGGFYTLDHSTNTYLVAPTGAFVQWYKAVLPVKAMADSIQRWISKPR